MNINNTFSNSIPWVPTELENLELPLVNLDLPLDSDTSELLALTPLTQEIISEENTPAQEATVSKTKRNRPSKFAHFDPQILAMVEDHKSYGQIAEKLNLTYFQVVRRWRDVISVEHPEVEYSPANSVDWKKRSGELDERIMGLFDAGGNFASVAKALDMTHDQVKKRWYRHLRVSNPEKTYKNCNRKRQATHFTPKKEKTLVSYMAKGFDYQTTADEMKMTYESVKDRWENKLAKDYPKIAAMRALLCSDEPPLSLVG